MAIQADQWKQAKRIFYQALDLDPALRESFIEKECGDQGELRDLVMNLIRADEETGTAVVDHPVHLSSGDQELALGPGDRVGNYEIIDEIGHGGMGVVYKARRSDQEIDKIVALKIIRRGYPQDLRRFRAERQILANLEHEHIARFYDGGRTELEVPFFVMEYVDGKPIHTYCEERNLTIKERLQLFLQVCDAVQFAHRNLIIHRDLKPSNLLVTPDGNVKLLDFGIAKILDPDEFQQSVLVTQAEHRLMTPAYASPEQLQGAAVSVATDVYALGVVLYELLCGQPPYRFDSNRLDRIERVVCDTDPPRPSQVVARTKLTQSAEYGDLTPGQFVKGVQKQLRGDLDNIVAMAMNKEPDKRYSSVDQFQADLQRHLTGLPVLARTPTFGYRAAKFVRRHGVVLSLAGIFIIMLILGLAGTSLGFIRAKKAQEISQLEADKANKTIALLQEFLSSVDPEKQGRDVKVIEFLEGSLNRVQEMPEDSEIKATLLYTFGKTLNALGGFDRACDLLKQCVDIRTQIWGSDHVQTVEAKNMLGVAHLAHRDYQQAERILGELLAAIERHHDVFDEAWRLTLLGNYAQALLGLGRLNEAETRLRELYDIRRKTQGSDDDETLNTMNDLGLTLMRLGKHQEAEEILQRAVDTRQRMFGIDHPRTLNAMDNLGRVLEAAGQYTRAESLFQDTYSTKKRILGHDHPHTVQSMENLATVAARMGRFERAETLQQQVVKDHTRISGRHHPDTIDAISVLVTILYRLNRLEECVALQREAVAFYRQHYGEHHHRTMISMNNFAVFLQATDQLNEATKMFRATLAARQEVLGPEHFQTLNTMANLAMALAPQGKLDEAESLLEETLEISQRVLGADHPDTLFTLYSLGVVANAGGQTQRAEESFRRAMTGQERVLGETHPDTLDSMKELTKALNANGKAAEAEELMQRLQRRQAQRVE